MDAASTQAWITQGGLAALCMALIVAVKSLWGKLNDERTARLEAEKAYREELQKAADARLADAKAYTDRILNVAEAVHGSVSQLSELIEMASSSQEQKPEPKKTTLSGGKIRSPFQSGHGGE